MSTKLREKLQQFLELPSEPLIAAYVLRTWPTATGPVLVLCLESQNERYVVKGAQVGKPVIVDHVVAHLGNVLGAPVGQPALIEISSDLVEIEPKISHFIPGLAHGTLFMKDCVDDRDIRRYCSTPENRSRFALLALLYGWCEAQDHQFIFSKSIPNLVHSVDHGPFLSGVSLNASEVSPPEAAQWDPFISGWCKFTCQEQEAALAQLSAVNEDAVLASVAAPPASWGITIEERVALAEFLLHRRQTLLDQSFGLSFTG